MEKTRVLIVDDDPNINQLIKLYLEKEGYETETAERGDDALNLFKKNPPQIVLLDLMLPKLAAEAGATEALKAADPMKWTGLMNSCKAQAEEVVLNELIYS